MVTYLVVTLGVACVIVSDQVLTVHKCARLSATLGTRQVFRFETWSAGGMSALAFVAEAVARGDTPCAVQEAISTA